MDEQEELIQRETSAHPSCASKSVGPEPQSEEGLSRTLPNVSSFTHNLETEEQLGVLQSSEDEV